MCKYCFDVRTRHVLCKGLVTCKRIATPKGVLLTVVVVLNWHLNNPHTMSQNDICGSQIQTTVLADRWGLFHIHVSDPGVKVNPNVSIIPPGG